MNTEPEELSSLESDMPQPIIAKLERVIRRMRRVALLRGCLVVAAVAVGTLLLLMAIDVSLPMASTPVRWLLSLAGLVVVVAAVGWFIVRPSRRRLTLAEVAQMVEQQRPELHERISSTVELHANRLTRRDDGRPEISRGSEQLIAALTEAATADVGHVDPRKEVSIRSAKPYFMAAVIVGSLFLLVCAIWPGQATVLLMRTVAPGINRDNVYAVNLTVQPGEVVVPIGEPLTIAASSAGDIEYAELHLIDSTGHETNQPMQVATNADGDTATIDIANVTGSFRYRVHADNALTRYYQITALPRPSVEQIEVLYEFPAYAGRSPHVQKEISQGIQAVAGTQIAVLVKANKAIAKAELLVAGSPTAQQAGTGPHEYAFTLTMAPDTTGVGLLKLEDEHGFSSDSVEFDVRSVNDMAPTVRIVDPNQSQLKLNPYDRLNLLYEAEDDFGIGAAELLIRLDEGAVQLLPQALSAAPLSTRKRQERALLNLAELELRQVQKVTVQVQVADNLPELMKGPNRGVSDPLVIEIDRAADAWLAQNVDSQSNVVQQDLQAVLDQLKQLKETSDALLKALESDDQAAEKAAELAGLVRSNSAEIAEAMDRFEQKWQNTRYASLVPELRQVEKEHLEQARKAAQLVQLSDDPDERLSQANEARQQVEQAVAKLETLLDDARQRTEDITAAAALAQLANQQQRLAAQATQQADATQPQDMLQDTSFEQLSQSRQQAEQLAQTADELAQGQRSLAEQVRALDDSNIDPEQLKKQILQLARLQEQLASESRQLEEQTRQLAQETATLPIGQPSQEQASQAAERLSEARSKSTEATDALETLGGSDEKQPSPAERQQAAADVQQAQQQAGDAMADASQKLRELSEQLGQQTTGQQQAAATVPDDQWRAEQQKLAEQLASAVADDEHSAASAALAEALEHATAAAQAQNAQQAAQAAEQASQSLASAVQAAQQSLGMPTPPTGSEPSTGSTAGRQPSETYTDPGSDPAASEAKMGPLEFKGKSASDWAKFTGRIEGGVQQGAQEGSSTEYRELVDRYFEELARQGGKENEE